MDARFARHRLFHFTGASPILSKMPAAIQCPRCQTEYPWNPDVAGQRLKCKCGEMIDMPALAPKAEVDELYDLADEPAKASQHGIADLQSAATAAAVAVDQSRQFACPYCGEKLDAGSTMCVFCGSNLEGALPETTTRTVSTAMQSAPPVSARPVVMRELTETEKSGTFRLIILCAMAMVVVAMVIVFIKHRLPASPAKDPFLRPADAAIVEKVQQGAEARQWLKSDDGHTLSGMLHKQAVFKVDQLYDLGAKRVIVLGGGSSLAIELPSESAKRKALFDWQKKWNTDNNFKLPVDEGQRWMEIQMHL